MSAKDWLVLAVLCVGTLELVHSLANHWTRRRVFGISRNRRLVFSLIAIGIIWLIATALGLD